MKKLSLLLVCALQAGLAQAVAMDSKNCSEQTVEYGQGCTFTLPESPGGIHRISLPGGTINAYCGSTGWDFVKPTFGCGSVSPISDQAAPGSIGPEGPSCKETSFNSPNGSCSYSFPQASAGYVSTVETRAYGYTGTMTAQCNMNEWRIVSSKCDEGGTGKGAGTYNDLDPVQPYASTEKAMQDSTAMTANIIQEAKVLEAARLKEYEALNNYRQKLDIQIRIYSRNGSGFVNSAGMSYADFLKSAKTDVTIPLVDEDYWKAQCQFNDLNKQKQAAGSLIRNQVDQLLNIEKYLSDRAEHLKAAQEQVVARKEAIGSAYFQ